MKAPLKLQRGPIFIAVAAVFSSSCNELPKVPESSQKEKLAATSGQLNATAGNAPSGYSFVGACILSVTSPKVGIMSSCAETHLDSSLSDREIDKIKTNENAKCLSNGATAKLSQARCDPKAKLACTAKYKKSQMSNNPNDSSVYLIEVVHFPDVTKAQMGEFKAISSTMVGDVQCTPDVESLTAAPSGGGPAVPSSAPTFGSPSGIATPMP